MPTLTARPLTRSLGAYYSVRSGIHDQFSRMILDFKHGLPSAIRFFEDLLRSEIPNFRALVVVPGHNPLHPVGPLHGIVERICRDNSTLLDASRSLRRTHFHEKLALGGDRSIDSHLCTMGVFQRERILSQNVLILDDVSTTGNSIEASRQLLLEAGASNVSALTLAQTLRR